MFRGAGMAGRGIGQEVGEMSSLANEVVSVNGPA